MLDNQRDVPPWGDLIPDLLSWS
jgi:hypothetical protein